MYRHVSIALIDIQDARDVSVFNTSMFLLQGSSVMPLLCGVTELEERGVMADSDGNSAVLELVHAEVDSNYRKPVERTRKLTEEGVNASHFLMTLAQNDALWRPSETQPWTVEAEDEVDAFLARYSIGQQWLLGVMHSLRSAKLAKRPTELAAGFLILSRLRPDKVSTWLPGINLGKTCQAGCALGGIISQAATIARQKLGLGVTA